MKTYLIIGSIIGIGAVAFIMRKKKTPVPGPRASEGDPTGNLKGAPPTLSEMVKNDIKLGDLNKLSLEGQIVESLKAIVDEFGPDLARTVEKVYRWETNHFKSGQFLRTFSPGMEKHTDNYPFGWSAMKDYWDKINFIPDFVSMNENKNGVKGGGPSKTFVRFPNVLVAMRSLAHYIRKYGDFARWYSLNPTSQSVYRDKVNSIIPKITNSIVK